MEFKITKLWKNYVISVKIIDFTSYVLLSYQFNFQSQLALLNKCLHSISII